MKRKFLIIPTLLLAGLSLVACKEEPKTPPVDEGVKTIYISPNGNDKNDGSETNPYDILTGVGALKKGDTLKVLPGRYMVPRRLNLTISGDPFNYITLENDSTEPAIFDFSALEFNSLNRGIELNGNYWHFKNLEIVNAGDNGLYIGGSHNIIENCQFHENRDTGLQLGRGSGSYDNIKDWPSYNLIKNCTSYNNYDDVTFGENADGFAAKLTVGYGNVFDGCIAYRNSDDGWDLFAKQDSGNIGTVFLYNCVSFENGFLLNKTTEAGVERFITRDGDGIGFKLGGSTMKGDVVMENCVAFNNRLHGIGDNSNPGVISVNNCTCYNNCAAIDENGVVLAPEDTTKGSNEAESSNFDIARDSNSYNNYTNLLSYATNATTQPDRYLGSTENSIFYSGTGNYLKITEHLDASCLNPSKCGVPFNGLNNESFKSLTAVNGLNNRDIHKTMRNADGSVQLGDFLSLVPGELKSSNIGADLTKTSYDEYPHYTPSELNEDMTEDDIKVQSAYDALRVNCNATAVYQDFLAPANFAGCSIYWSSSDTNLVSVGDEIRNSISGTQEIIISVFRTSETKQVTLTAEIEYNNSSKKKEFVLNVMQDTPGIGEIYVKNVEDDKVIIDQFERFFEPSLVVTNLADYSGKELSKDLYNLKTTYTYQESKTAKAYAVDAVYSSRPGVYTVTHQVQMKDDATKVKNYSYTVYVCSPASEVDFVGSVSVSVHRDGFNLTGELSNVTGNIYILANNEETVTAEQVKESGEKFEFRNDVVSFDVDQSNDSGYFIHYLVENKSGSKTSAVYKKEIKVTNITTEAEFYNLLTGSSESTTIYLLQNDLDFTDKVWGSSSAQFKGLLNGLGHKVSNITTTAESLINKMSNGTIMNLDFEEITLNSAKADKERVGIISTMSGGYIHNVHIKNINSVGSDRIGGVVGQVGIGKNYFSQISVINDENHIITGSRSAAIIGFVQNETKATELEIHVSNCYVKANVGKSGDQYVGGVLGRFDNRQSWMTLDIEKVYFEGKIVAGTYAGGIVGGFNYGHSLINLKDCVSKFECVYNGTEFTIALKNCSPIIGRSTTSNNGGHTYVTNCYASIGEYVSDYDSRTDDFENNLKKSEFFKETLEFDLEHIWQFADEISLR
ncbi:MAG: right-handed parallel beta-helix repeat-containing protein [Anaeroplasmataceae bacterium]|nr:right-handed parallel beta-helix repeat-containing protein [Anaeroplasmataceae bacterium]